MAAHTATGHRRPRHEGFRLRQPTGRPPLAAGIRRVVSDSSHERHFGDGSFSVTGTESGGPGGRDPYSRFKAERPASNYGRAASTIW